MRLFPVPTSGRGGRGDWETAPGSLLVAGVSEETGRLPVSLLAAGAAG